MEHSTLTTVDSLKIEINLWLRYSIVACVVVVVFVVYQVLTPSILSRVCIETIEWHLHQCRVRVAFQTATCSLSLYDIVPASEYKCSYKLI